MGEPIQRATITYTAPSSFIATDHWKQVLAAWQVQLPLRNLHWKSASRPNIRTIQELNVNLVNADVAHGREGQGGMASQIPKSVLDKPLLNVYVVVCEDTETYKNTVKKQIKDWHTVTTQRKNQEWIIVHIVKPDAKSTSKNIFQVKASVLDKIKADFNVEKRDRCVQLVWSQDYENPAAWAEFINKVKDGVLSAFDITVTQREEEVRRSEGQRQMPGWNFCTYFILKESLAHSFEGMSLYEDALQTYEDLEALFFQVTREKNLSWFGALITPSPRDDSAALLSQTKKPYRDLILANSISVFDIRVYMLARMAALFARLGHVVEIGRRVLAFLGSFGRKLREIERELTPCFVETWTYSSALSVVDQLDTWSASMELGKPIVASLSAVKGELIELARHQLDTLGISMSFLPSFPPFSSSLPPRKALVHPNAGDRSSLTITKSELLGALRDKEVFFELYVNLTNRAIELYASAGRRKFALKMHGSLAAVDVVRVRTANALQTYTSLPAHYSPHGWTSLEAFMLTQALSLHASTRQPRDRDWVDLALEFLRAYVVDFGHMLLPVRYDGEQETIGGPEFHERYLKELLEGLKEAAEELEAPLGCHDHPALSISIPSSQAYLCETRDGAMLEVQVRNSLPCELPIDEVNVVVSGRDGAKLVFLTEEIDFIPSGTSRIKLFCASATFGTYALHSTQASISKINLQWIHTSSTGKPSKSKKPTALVRIPKDLRAVDVKLRQPQQIQLGNPPRVVVSLSTGRNELSNALVRLNAPSGVQFQLEEFEIVGEDEIHYEIIEGSIMFLDLQADTTISVSVPHSDASAFHTMRVDAIVEYTTTAEPSITRTVKFARVVLTALPLAVNVEDFFRGTRLFTRFTLSTTSHQHVRVRSTDLQWNREGEGVIIKRGMLRSPEIVTITPQQSGRFLFQLDSKRGQVKDPLHLHITYRMLREEVEGFIHYAVYQALSEPTSASINVHPDVLIDKLIQALESDASWVDLYGVTGKLIVPPLSGLDKDKDSQVVQLLGRIIDNLTEGRPKDSLFDEEEWREIVIPVDVPQMHILAAARIQILSPSHSTAPATGVLPPLYAGQPISVLLSITTSFHWAPDDDIEATGKTEGYTMRFDVEEMTREWLVSGRKRGDFVAKNNSTYTLPITLIALHHGSLALPKVAVNALPIQSHEGIINNMQVLVPSCETHQIHGAERVLVLPRGGRTTFVVDMGDEV